MIPHHAAKVVLDKAASLVGGRRNLARHLGVAQAELANYIDGATPVPEDIYLTAVDIVLGPLEPLQPDVPRPNDRHA